MANYLRILTLMLCDETDRYQPIFFVEKTEKINHQTLAIKSKKI